MLIFKIKSNKEKKNQLKQRINLIKIRKNLKRK